MFKLSLLALVLCAQLSHLQFVEQCGGSYLNNLIQISPSMWNTSSLRSVGDAQVQVQFAENPDSSQGQQTGSTVTLLQADDGTGSSTASLSRGALWFQTPIGLADRTVAQFNLKLSDISCGQVSSFSLTQIELYPTIFIDDLNDCGPQGFALVISDDSLNSIGGYGSGLGYNGLRGVFAIEFDMRIDSVTSDDSSGKPYQISVIQRNSPTYDILIASETFAAGTQTSPSNFAISVAFFPSESDDNILQVYVSINGVPQLTASVNMEGAGISLTRLYTLGFTGTSFKNGQNRPRGTLELDNLVIYKPRPLTTEFSAQIQQYTSNGIIIQYLVRAMGSCMSASSIFAMPSTQASYSFTLAPNSTICQSQGNPFITTTYDATQRTYAAEVKVLLKCTESGIMSVQSGYSVGTSNFVLNGRFYQDVSVSSASFDQIYLVIPTAQLDSQTPTKLAAGGKTSESYSFTVDVVDVQNAAYSAAPNVVKSLIHIEEPQVVLDSLTPSTDNQTQASYKIEASSTIAPDSTVATQFTLSFTPSLQGDYILRSSAFQNGASYTISVTQDGAFAGFSLAALTTPASSQTSVTSGSSVQLTVTLQDTLGNELSEPGTCSLDQSYYYLSSDATRTKVADMLYSDLKLTASITTAGTYTLQPVLTCPTTGNVDLTCEACQVTVLAETTASVTNSVIRSVNGDDLVSVVQGNDFVAIFEVRDQYGNAIADTSGITISLARIRDPAGSLSITLVTQTLSLTQDFLLFISDESQLSTYESQKPRTGYYQIEVQISGSSSGTLLSTFDLVASDYTAPAIGIGDYDTYYRNAILINPEGRIKAGRSAVLFVQLRTTNLIDQDEDKTNDIALLFYEDNNGSPGSAINDACNLDSTQWAGNNQPGVYFLNFRCTSSTNKWLRLRLGNQDDRNDVYLPMIADTDNLSLVMSGDASLYQDEASLTFNTDVTRVPFQLQDSNGNTYLGEEGIIDIAYEFGSSTQSSQGRLISQDGQTYYFDFPLTTPDQTSYELRFSEEYTDSQTVVYLFSKTVAADAQQISALFSSCQLLTSSTTVQAESETLTVQCNLYSDQEQTLAQSGVQNSGFEIKALHGEQTSSVAFTLNSETTLPVGVYQFVSGTFSIPGRYHIETNLARLSVSNKIFSVIASFSLTSSTILKASNLDPLVQSPAPVILKSQEFPEFVVIFKSENGYSVDLSLVHGSADSIRNQFNAVIKTESDAATQINLDFFSIGGTQLEISLSNSNSNRESFTSLPDGLYYVEVTYSPNPSQLLRGYFYLQHYTLIAAQEDQVDYAQTLITPASTTVTSGVRFNVYIELRSSSAERITTNLPALSDIIIAATSSNVTPQLFYRIQEGPVLGSFIASVSLTRADSATTLTFTISSNSAGTVICSVQPGSLAQLNGVANTLSDFEVGNTQTYSFVPWDASQNIINSLFSWNQEDLAALISVTHSNGAAVSVTADIADNQNIQFNINTLVAGTLNLTTFPAGSSQTFQALSQTQPSTLYSYSALESKTIEAGATTSIRLFVYDQFHNLISGLSADEIAKYTAFLECENKVAQVSGSASQVSAIGSVASHLAFSITPTQACIYKASVYYEDTKFLCSDCVLSVNAGSLDIEQTRLIDSRGVEWNPSNTQFPYMIINSNVDFLSIPTILKDSNGNVNTLSQTQTISATFTSGTNPRPDFCYSPTSQALELCDFASDWQDWLVYSQGNNINENFRLTLSDGSSTSTVTFRVNVVGDANEDYDVDSLPLELENTQISLLANTGCKVGTKQLEGEITLRTQNGMRTATRVDLDLQTAFTFKDASEAQRPLAYTISQLSKSGSFKFKLDSSLADNTIPVVLDIKPSSTAEVTSLSSVKSVSIPDTTSSSSVSSNGVFQFSCQPGDLAILKLYNIADSSEPISTPNPLTSATTGTQYEFLVKGFDSAGNQIELTNPNSFNLEIYHELDNGNGATTLTYFIYKSTTTSDHDSLRLSFIPTLNGNYKISSSELQVEDGTNPAQTETLLSSTSWEPSAKRSQVIASFEHTASTISNFELWVEVRDTFDNYVDANFLETSDRQAFHAVVRRYLDDSNRYSDPIALPSAVVATNPNQLNRVMLKWEIPLSTTGQHLFTVTFKDEEVSCRNCMTLVDFGAIDFPNTLFTYYDTVTKKETNFPGTLALDNEYERPSFRIYPRDVEGNLIENFGNLGITAKLANIEMDVDGGNTDSFKILSFSSSQIQAYRTLPQGSYTLEITANSETVQRSVYLLGGDQADSGTSNNEIEPQNTLISIQDSIQTTAGLETTFTVTLRVANGKRKNTFNAESLLLFYTEYSSLNNFVFEGYSTDVRPSDVAGRFTIIFRATQSTHFAAGDVFLRLRVNSVVVDSIKILLDIDSSTPSSISISDQSISSGTVINPGNADSSFSFKFSLSDTYGNPVSLSASRFYFFDLGVRRAIDLNSQFVNQEYQLAQSTATGQITCTLKEPLTAGSYRVESALLGTTHTFVLSSGAADLPYSYGSLSPGQPRVQTAGSDIQFTIYARDKYNNPVTSDSSVAFTARLLTPSGNYVQGEMESSSSTGEYSYKYTATESGIYKWIPYYKLFAMASLANSVRVNPSELDLGASGNGFSYYEGSTSTSEEVWSSLQNQQFELKVGAPFRLRLDYVDQYGNRLLAPQTSGVTFSNSRINGNEIATDIRLTYTEQTADTEKWVIFEINPDDLNAYNLLVGKQGYSVNIEAQQSGNTVASTTLQMELISALDESDASNGIPDPLKTSVSPTHQVGRAGSVMEFFIELRTQNSFRSVSSSEISVSNIQLINEEQNETDVLSFSLTPTDLRGRYRAEVIFTKTYPLTIVEVPGEPGGQFPYFGEKQLKIRIGMVDSENILRFTPVPGRLDLSKTVRVAFPSGSLISGTQAEIKLQLKDAYDNDYLGSGLVLNKMRMFLNGREYLDPLDYRIESDNNNNLAHYSIVFYPTIPPLTWEVNLYYQQDNFLLTPVYTNSFPTALFTLESVLDIARTQFISDDLDQGIVAGRALTSFVLIRDQFGFCYSDTFSDIRVSIAGPGSLNVEQNSFINQGSEVLTNVDTVVKTFSDCYAYYIASIPSSTIQTAGTYYIQAYRESEQGTRTNLGNGRSFTVFQGELDVTKTQLQFKITEGDSTLFRNQQGLNLQMRAGQASVFYISTFDEFQNSITTQRFTSIVIESADTQALAQGQFSYLVSYEFKNGTFPVSLTISKTGTYNFNYEINGVDITSTINSGQFGPQAYVVSSGECKANKIVLPSLSDSGVFDCVEGDVCSFTITCRDVLENTLEVGGDSVEFQISSLTLLDAPDGLVGGELKSTITDQGNGEYLIQFSPNYAGSYIGVLYVNSIAHDTALTFSASRSICTGATPYLCYGTNTCVAQYINCPPLNLAICQSQQGKIRCISGGQDLCVETTFSCDTPNGYEKCESTKIFLPTQYSSSLCYQRFNLDCASIYPDTPYQCQDGTCRRSEDQCPSQHVCPPGTHLCPDFSCSITGLDGCNYALMSTPCTLPTPYRCSDTSCAADLSSCPSSITCSDPSYVVCPDNSCAINELGCRQINQCASGQIKCPDGSCALSQSSCPQRPSCGISKGLCEDFTCRLECVGVVTRSLMPTRNLQTQSSVICDTNSVKCPTGQCLSNYNLCSPRRVCGNGLVKCSDDSCALSIDDCLSRSVISTSGLYSCFDGSLVSSQSECPTRVSCPTDYPIKCHDDFCVDQESKCSPYIECPASSPFRCWSGDCRRSVNDCPSAIHCPTELPILCQDGSCHQDRQQCKAIVEAMGTCPDGYLRCSNGSCASAKSLCPPLFTCSDDNNILKCWDGRCVSSLDKCPSPNGRSSTCSSQDAPYRCPDGTCSSNYQNCPTSLFCPVEQPVRCSDNSCKSSVLDCSKSYTECPDYTTPCPDGVCSVTGSCSVGVTCPLGSPYLCQDNTCREDPSDCPPIISCSNSQFYCRNGDCVSSRESCTTFEACPANKPVRCPDLSCSSSLSECTETSSCPRGYTRCNDSSCKEDRDFCSEGTGSGSSDCPRQASTSCFDGSCSVASEFCPNDTTNCPFYAPQKCPDGRCVASNSNDCDNNQASSTDCALSGWVLCDDGSCAPTDNSCPRINGCADGRRYRCQNGGCTWSYFGCQPDICPSTASVKCPNGLCVTSQRFCLDFFTQSDYDYCTSIAESSGSASTLVPCADGTCVNNSDMCSPLYDCDINEVRCGDGSCRQSSLLCPLVGSTCPSHRSFRCNSGVCSVSALTCPSPDNCPSSFSVICPDGRCVNDATECTSDTTQWTNAANGCPLATPTKCWNDACVVAESDCPLTNLCPQDKPIKCGNGFCFASVSECQSLSFECADNQVRCPDFTCANSWESCTSTRGCPMNAPFRCPDGSCAAVGNAVMGSNSCKPGVMCDLSEPFRCQTGTCKGQSNFCPLAYSYPACPQANPHRCIDGSCAENESGCPSLACPVGSPYLCRNGQCASKMLDCAEQIGSCPTDEPILCISGLCASTPALCVPENIATGNTSICPSEVPVLCYDGSCVNNIKNCPLLPSCTQALRPYRCSNGECVADQSNCLTSTTSIGSCASGLSKCEDGYCREECAPFNGCPTSQPYLCPNGICGQDISDCAGASNCPVNQPFRCGDYSCKETTVDCDLPTFMSKPASVTLTFNSIATSTFELIYSPRTQVLQGELTIPPNALTSSSLLLQQTTSTSAYLNIYPIADSVLYETYYTIPDNRIAYVRQYYTLDRVEPGEEARLTYSQSLISAAIELEVDQSRYSPVFAFQTSLSLYLSTPSFVNRNQDVCLCKLESQEWICKQRVHSYDSGSNLASFNINQVGRYAVLFAPNQNYDTSTQYAICGSWSCEAPSDFLLLVFLGPLIVIIALVVTFWVFLNIKKQRRMKDELERNQEDLFFKSSTEVEGSDESNYPDRRGEYKESPSFSGDYTQQTSALQDRSDMRMRPPGADDLEMADLKQRSNEVANELAREKPTIPRVEPYIEGQN